MNFWEAYSLEGVGSGVGAVDGFICRVCFELATGDELWS